MAKHYDEIPESLIEWIKKQHMFWVASAPLSPGGHVNVSPKGIAGCFHVVNSQRVWYQDLSGSGVETISHIRENGRITIMFNAFEGPPRIMRLYGIGTVHEYGTPEYESLIPPETRMAGSRAAIVIDVYQCQTSCGFAVPIYDFVEHRTQLVRALDKKEECDRALSLAASAGVAQGGIKAYWRMKSLQSVDGLPGLLTAPDSEVVPFNIFDKEGPRPKMRRLSPSSREGGAFKLSNSVTLGIGIAIGALAATVLHRILPDIGGLAN